MRLGRGGNILEEMVGRGSVGEVEVLASHRHRPLHRQGAEQVEVLGA